jgi:hypothetical protein
VLPFIVLAWAGLLLSPAVSHSETLVNASFDPPAISGQSYDPTPATDAPAGVFTFIATFCNKATSQPLGNRLESRTAELTGGNELLNRSSGSGATSVLAFPPIDGYADLDLAPGECVPVTYEIGLQQRAPFQFFVDTWLYPPTQLFSNGTVQGDVYRVGRVVDDFILGVRSDPLVPGPTIKGVKWKGVNSIFGVDPGNEFRIRIYESNRCVPPPRTVGTRPNTGWDDPIYEAVVTASRVVDAANNVYEYTASIPEFTPTAGCRYFLGIENTSNAGGFDQGGWAWNWDTCFFCDQYAWPWTGSDWGLVILQDIHAFELTD